MAGCLLTNVDRTAKNTNMLMWHKELADRPWCFSVFPSFVGELKKQCTSFTQIKNMHCWPEARTWRKWTEYKEILTDEILREIVDLIPMTGCIGGIKEETQQDIRDIYFQFLTERIRHSELFVKEAQDRKHLYEYAVIRIVPKVEREEFMNVELSCSQTG